MFEESVSAIPSIWASMNSWFTPTVLFILLNVMIGTIAFTSTLANQKHHHNHQNHHHQQQNQGQNQPNLVRSPSVLQRLRSINFYSYRSQEPPPPPQQQQNHFKLPTPDSSDPHYNHQIQPQVNFEIHSQYIFAQPHQEIKQAGFYGNHQDQTQSHYFPQQLYQEKPQEITQTHYFPEQIYQEKPQEITQTHYFPEQIYQEKPQEITQTHYFPEQIYEEKPQENQSQYFFQQTNEEKHQEHQTPFDFQQTREVNAQKNESHFDSQQTNEEKGQETDFHFDSSEEAHEENLENDDELKSLDEVYSQLAERHVIRSKSDTKPAGGEVPTKLPAKMKKSASMKSPFKHLEEKEIVEARRPATVKERKAAEAADEGVDAKADDFINRFKEQLKLQRIDSIIRYKEMTGRGADGR